MYDLKPISDSVAQLTKSSFSRKFVSLSRILTQWEEIVGEEMAGKTQPAKLHYRKPKAANESPKATLDIAASSADATVLHYQKGLILERINQLFGERWVTDIKFVHVPVESRKTVAKIQPRMPTKEDLAKLQASLEIVEDEEIKKRLERLGQGVLRRPQNNHQ